MSFHVDQKEMARQTKSLEWHVPPNNCSTRITSNRAITMHGFEKTIIIIHWIKPLHYFLRIKVGRILKPKLHQDITIFRVLVAILLSDVRLHYRCKIRIRAQFNDVAKHQQRLGYIY